jgi:myo-inositol-1(or 4)-monophosphatase
MKNSITKSGKLMVSSKQPVVGAVYAPFVSGVSSHPQDSQNGTLYSGATGLGSFLTPVDPTSFPTLVAAQSRISQICAPTQYSARLPLLKPAGVIPPEAPKGCLFAAEWGKDRKDRPDGNLTKKVNSMWNMACEVGGRNGKGGERRSYSSDVASS